MRHFIRHCIFIGFAALLSFVWLPQSRAGVATPAVPGLQPTTATLEQVLKLYHQAGERAGIDAYSETWAETTGGLSGTETVIHNGGNYVETDRLGPFVTSFGRYKEQRWYQDENGYTVLVHGTHKFAQQTDETLRAAVNEDVTTNVQLLGEVTTPVHAYVVELTPPAGRRTWLFIDATTGDVVRRDSFSPRGQYTATYDDYRTVHGVHLPWHVHWSDGFVENDDDERMTSFTAGAPTDPHAFDIPHDRRVVVEFPAGQHIVRIPATITDDQVVIVHASINGHGADFVLDSGSSGIVIDDQVAKKLGLTTYGTTKETMAATYTSHRTVIPELRVGDLRLHNVSADALPFAWDIDDNTQAVGLLGFDFIADMVVHIDYHNKKVEAIDNNAFTPPANAIPLNVDLDDQVPYVAGSVGGVTGSHFTIDTGAAFTMIYKGFAQAHPDAVQDQGLGRQIRMANSFDQELEGVGNGTFTAQPAEVKNFQVGQLNFTRWLLMVSDNPAAYEEGDDIGTIGQDFLFLFDVYFDYEDSLVYLVPNDEFHKAFKM